MLQKKKQSAAQAHQDRLNDNLKRTGSIKGTHHPKVAAALRIAKARNQPLFLLFTSPRCKICRKMDAEVMGRNFPRNIQVYRSNTKREPEVADHYMSTPYIPHYKLISPDGKIIKSNTGYANPERFFRWLDW